MKNNTANRIGFASLACSLAFWFWACITLFTPIGHTEDFWALRVLGAVWLWIALWILGFLLGLAAAAKGSRLWLFAALFALASCGAVFWVASGVQW